MRTIFGLTLGLVVTGVAIAGCSVDAADDGESTGTSEEALRKCVDGDCGPVNPPPPKPKPTPHPPAPPPTPSTLTITADQLQTALGIALGGTVVQVSQAQRSPANILGGHVPCHYDTTAEHQCQAACIADGDDVGSPGERANCLKRCQSLQTLVCTAPVCGTYPESSFIQFPSYLKSISGQKDCDPNDCQPCAAGKEPALFDRALVGIPYPIVNKTLGAITYHCSVTKLRFEVPADLPVAVDLGGIHLTVVGTADSPAIACDNGAPDLDIGSPTITVDLSPFAVDGKITATAHARFAGSVHAHNGIGEIINWIDDAQGLVNKHASSAIDAQVSKLGSSLGGGLDSYVRTRLPKGARIDHTAYGTSGLTIYYFPS